MVGSLWTPGLCMALSTPSPLLSRQEGTCCLPPLASKLPFPRWSQQGAERWLCAVHQESGDRVLKLEGCQASPQTVQEHFSSRALLGSGNSRRTEKQALGKQQALREGPARGWEVWRWWLQGGRGGYQQSLGEGPGCGRGQRGVGGGGGGGADCTVSGL